MYKIKQEKIKNCDVIVPGSKSFSHRILIAAALSDGKCTIKNVLKSEDTSLTMSALKQMGVKIEKNNDTVEVYGTSGVLKPAHEPIYLGNSGTSVRLLTGVAAIGDGKYTLTGTERMQQRPISDLLDGLTQIGVLTCCVNNDNCPPIEIVGSKIKGGSLDLKCGISSQYLSSLLLIAPYTKEGLEIRVSEGPVSKPYIDMTVDIMNSLGVELKREGYDLFKVKGSQIYKSGSYTVESDCSQAGYFWAAAAITGAKIKVKGTTENSRQGDVKFARVLESMGAQVNYETDGISVMGKSLSGIEVDMSDMPDIVPTLAVVASFAKGKTIIKNVAHLKQKESDRLGAVECELKKIGIDVKATESGLIINGCNLFENKSAINSLKSTEIKTYDDHRIAMCFAVAGLIVPGITIMDEKCVEKSFPNFWDVFEGLY